MVKHRKPPSQTWRAFLENHVRQLVSVDFFVVPTVSFRILYVFLILAHERRRVVHFNVTGHPTAEWTAAQLMQAFPWDTAPRYLLRDRDQSYGEAFRTPAAHPRLREKIGVSAQLCSFDSPQRDCAHRDVRASCSARSRTFQDCITSRPSQGLAALTKGFGSYGFSGPSEEDRAAGLARLLSRTQHRRDARRLRRRSNLPIRAR